MRRITLLLPLFVLLLLFSCAKEQINADEVTGTTLEDRGPKPKINVCHYDEDNNTWHLINVSLNAWPAHEGHGDVRLDDQDGDGYYPDNECGVGPMGDCDDLDASIYPGAEEICEDGVDQDCDGNDPSCTQSCDGVGDQCCFCDVIPPLNQIETVSAGNEFYRITWFIPGDGRRNFITLAGPAFCGSGRYICHICGPDTNNPNGCNCANYNTYPTIDYDDFLSCAEVIQGIYNEFHGQNRVVPTSGNKMLEAELNEFNFVPTN